MPFVKGRNPCFPDSVHPTPGVGDEVNVVPLMLGGEGEGVTDESLASEQQPRRSAW